MALMSPISWSLGVIVYDNDKKSLSVEFNYEAAPRDTFADKLLLSGVESGNRFYVALAVSLGAWLETNDSKALLRAAEKGDTAIVRKLLKSGALAEGVNGEFYKDGQNNYLHDTPLRLAVRGGHRETAELLLQHGARKSGLNWSAEQD